jgi:hypothetical protein
MQRLQSSALLGLAATVSDLLVDLLKSLKAAVRSRSSLVAENFFLRKQLAFYQEHEVKPRRLTDAARIAMVFWSRWFKWKDALMVVQPDTLIRGTDEDLSFSGAGSRNPDDRACRGTSVS